MVGVRRVMDHAGFEVFGEQGGPRLLEDGSGDLGFVSGGDEQLGEEALIGRSSDRWATEAVDLVAAAHER